MNRQEPQFLSAGRGNEGSLVAVLANGTTAILLPLNDGDTAEDEDFEIKTLPTLHVEDPFVDVREGSEVQVHPCVYCSHTFKTKEEHKQHLVQVHSVTTPRIRCPWENCGKAFVSRSALDAHSKNHLLPRVFNCDHCPSSFCDANRLKAHLLLHAEQKPFRCSHCDKGFPNKSVLLAHTRTHSSERPFVCPYCEPKVAFKSRGNLREHIKYHMGIKDFRCLDCHRRFVTHRDLKRHQLSHEGIQPFECDICGLRFTRKSSLSRHLKKNPKEHQNRTSFSCQGCRGRYETLQELRSHRLASKKCQTLGGRHVIAPSVLDEHELRGTEQRLRYDDMKIIRLPRSDINRSKLKVIPELSGRKDVVEELEREQEERQKEMAERELRKLWNEKRKADAKNAKGSRPRSCSRAVVGRRPRISRPKAARESEEGVTDITPPTDQSQPEEVDETDQSQPGVVDETDQSQPGEVDGTDQSSEEEEESLEPDPLRIQRMIFRPKFRLKTNSTGEVVLQDFHRKSKVFPHEIFHPKEISLEKFDEIMNNSSKIRLDSQSHPEEDENSVEHPMRISIEKDAPLQCYICSSIFVSVAALDYHILKHREKPFHCQICFNDFETLTELETHVKIHAPNHSFRCQTCFRTFRLFIQYKKHFQASNCSPPPSPSKNPKLQPVHVLKELLHRDFRKDQVKAVIPPDVKRQDATDEGAAVAELSLDLSMEDMSNYPTSLNAFVPVEGSEYAEASLDPEEPPSTSQGHPEEIELFQDIVNAEASTEAGYTATPAIGTDQVGNAAGPFQEEQFQVLGQGKVTSTGTVILEDPRTLSRIEEFDRLMEAKRVGAEEEDEEDFLTKFSLFLDQPTQEPWSTRPTTPPPLPLSHALPNPDWPRGCLTLSMPNPNGEGTMDVNIALLSEEQTEQLKQMGMAVEHATFPDDDKSTDS